MYNQNRLYQLISVINKVKQKVAGSNPAVHNPRLHQWSYFFHFFHFPWSKKLNDFEIKCLIIENNVVCRWL